MNNSLSKIFAIQILRARDGTRIYSQYYPQHFPKTLLRVPEGNLSNLDVQKKFEKSLWEKGSRLCKGQEAILLVEIYQYCQFTVVVKQVEELNLLVVGDYTENEIVLAQVLQCFYESLSHITREKVTKKNLLENLDTTMIMIDEMCHQGIIITIEPGVVVARAQMKSCEAINLEKQDQSSGGGGAFSSVFATAKRTFAQQFMG